MLSKLKYYSYNRRKGYMGYLMSASFCMIISTCVIVKFNLIRAMVGTSIKFKKKNTIINYFESQNFKKKIIVLVEQPTLTKLY